MMKIWDRAEQTLVGVLGLAALGFALWQVLSRYLFPRESIGFAEEVVVYLVVWAIMIVSSQLVRTSDPMSCSTSSQPAWRDGWRYLIAS
jgi:C4-dicarboxylate transporter DctQ subunit